MKAGADPDPSMIASAVHHLEQRLVPVPSDPEERHDWNSAIGERLNELAAKISPTMPADQGKVWRDAMTKALSDLPAFVALTAAQRAIHRPMKFMNEVEAVIREIAELITAERREAIWRLKSWLAEIERASAPVLPAPPPMPPELTAEEIRRMSTPLLRMGMTGGWLSAAQITEAGCIVPPTDDQPAKERNVDGDAVSVGHVVENCSEFATEEV